MIWVGVDFACLGVAYPGMASIRVPLGGVTCLVVETVYENGGNPSAEHLSDID